MTLKARLRSGLTEPSAQAIAIQLAGAAAAFLVYLAITRIFGAGISGAYALFVQTVIAAATISLFGYDQKALRSIADGIAAGAPSVGWLQVGTFVRRLIVALLLVGAALVLARPWLVQAGFNPSTLWLLPIAAAGYALLRFVTSALRGASAVRSSQALVSAQPLLMLAAVALLALSHGTAPAATEGLEALYTASIILPLVLAAAILLARAKDWRGTGTPGTQAAPKADTHALGLAIVAQTLTMWAGFAAMGYILDPAEVAVYQACFLLMAPFDMVRTTYLSAEAPRFAPVLAAHDTGRLWTIHAGHTRLLLFLTAIPLLLIVALAEPILALFSGAFESRAPALQLFAAGMAVNMLFSSATTMLMMDARDTAFLRVTLAALLAWAIVYALTITALGVVGAALAYFVQMLVTQAGAWWIMKRHRPGGATR